MTKQAQKVHFISLGCPKNRIDTETMLAGIQSDYQIIADVEEAAFGRLVNHRVMFFQSDPLELVRYLKDFTMCVLPVSASP